MKFGENNLRNFFNVVIAGESKTYNDHNWYEGSRLRSYFDIAGRDKTPYPFLKKKLSDMTIGEVRELQANSRSNGGQLWATGRYQIIPNTLSEKLLNRAGLSNSDMYNKKNQDKLGLALLEARSPIRKYLNQEVADTTENLHKASLSMAQIWSSIGVPYQMNGRYGQIEKNQSYYSGGGDNAHVTTEDTQEALKKLRSTYGKVDAKTEKKKSRDKLFRTLGYTTLGLTVVGLAVGFWYFTRPKK
jgi:hypothetical protein